ncbi:hypothetical protein [Streptomyces sp. NPDC058451]|uniref:hypothetical protein n=1 Tax=Streptomyces sp. NPDC058451 TaxID=3346506 RepID=UPI00365864EE
MDLSTPAGLESLARSVAEQLGADRTEKDGDTGRVRVVYADGRALELTPNRPRIRIAVTAVLPEQASAHGIEVKAITVTALPRPRPSEAPAKATARAHGRPHVGMTAQARAVASPVRVTCRAASTRGVPPHPNASALRT